MDDAKGNPGDTRRLARLDELDDYKVADGEPDIRGWDVLASDRRRIGEVHGLIADTVAMEVRYLDVEIDGEALGLESDRHVLLPIGQAALDDDDDQVFLAGLSAADLASLPAYDHAPLTEEDELALRRQFDAGFSGTGPASTNFYAHPHYDQTRFFGRRRAGRGDAGYITRAEEELVVGKRARARGEVTVSKHVETERVRQQVPVMREEVTVERRPISGEMRAGSAEIGGDQEIRVPVREEEVVVGKRVVPKEEVVIRKATTQRTESVEADLRKERLDVDRAGDRTRDSGGRDERR